MRRKVAITLVVLVGLALPTVALSDDNSDLRGFGGPIVQSTKIAGESEWMAGGYGGVYVKDHLAIGMAGFGSASELGAAGLPGTAEDRSFEYSGGFIATPFHASSQLIITPALLLGGGTFQYDSDRKGISMHDELFVIEPTITAQFRAASFLRLDVGAGYRLVSSVDTPGLDEDDLSEVSARMGLSFGNY